MLTEEHRSRRLDRIIDIYGDELRIESLEQLRRSGPLTWDSGHRDGRLGVLFGVTPLQIAFDEAGEGMTIFLSQWGGESFYWGGHNSPAVKDTIGLLTDRSAPAIVEIAVQVESLNTYTWLWPVFVGQLDGRREPWTEFSTRKSIPPERVLNILDPASDRWPLAPGDC